MDILDWEGNLEINFGALNHQARYYLAITVGNKTY